MNEEGRPHIRKDDWGLLPFMALPDGAHLYVSPEIVKEGAMMISPH